MNTKNYPIVESQMLIRKPVSEVFEAMINPDITSKFWFTKSSGRVEPGTVRFERLLPGPIERGWAYLTESEKRGKWLASGEMELRIGGKVELNFYHADLSPLDDPIPEKYKQMEQGHTLTGRITRLDPPRLLSYTWGDDSEVTFKLTPQNDEVLLTLTHRRLGDDIDMLVSVGSGWHTHLGILVDHFNKREPKGFWSVHSKMEEAYRQRLSELNHSML